MSLPRRATVTRCGSCGGSGYFAGTYGDVECIDCGGEGSWEADEPAPAPRAKYVPSPEYLAWCEKIDRDPLKHLEPKSGDPLLEKRDRRFG